MSEDNQPLILIVDDQPSNIHVLASILRQEYRIKTATDGETALHLASREDRPALLLLDVMMPGLSGHDVLQRLRANPTTQTIPVIFITANMEERSELAALDQGADDYLTKPVVAPILKARVRNVIRRSQTETQLRLFAALFKHLGEGIVITDPQSRIVDVNPAYCRMLGYSREELIGATPMKVASRHHDTQFYDSMWQQLRSHGQWRGEIWDRRKDGELVPQWLTVNALYDRQGHITHYIGMYADISTLKSTEARLEQMAYYDPLTQLPNRALFRDRLQQAITVCQREGLLVALLFLDLDRFKEVNDSLGHDVGDELLVEVAKRLRSRVRARDTVARLGGDEFTIVLKGINNPDEASPIADKILASLQEPFTLAGEVIYIGASIGISLFPADGDSYEQLTKRADIALYRAKSAGRGQHTFYATGELS